MEPPMEPPDGLFVQLENHSTLSRQKHMLKKELNRGLPEVSSKLKSRRMRIGDDGSNNEANTLTIGSFTAYNWYVTICLMMMMIWWDKDDNSMLRAMFYRGVFICVHLKLRMYYSALFALPCTPVSYGLDTLPAVYISCMLRTTMRLGWCTTCPHIVVLVRCSL